MKMNIYQSVLENSLDSDGRKAEQSGKKPMYDKGNRQKDMAKPTCRAADR